MGKHQQGERIGTAGDGERQLLSAGEPPEQRLKPGIDNRWGVSSRH